MAIRIPYGDSGSLTPRFDSSSYSFGSIIYFDRQTKVGGLVLDSADIISNRSISTLFKDSAIDIVISDSNDFDIVFDEFSITGGNFTGTIDADTIVIPSSLFKDSGLSAVNTLVLDEPVELEDTSPTQVWIG